LFNYTYKHDRQYLCLLTRAKRNYYADVEMQQIKALIRRIEFTDLRAVIGKLGPGDIEYTALLLGEVGVG